MQREPNELIARYALEPSLRDIYVEGSRDALIVRWLLRAHGHGDVGVYPIESVHLPYSMFVDSDLPDNNRSRVISLASFFDVKLANATARVLCIADKDLDALLGSSPTYPCLVYTEFSCMEMYFLNESVLGKFLELFVGGFPHESVTVMELLIPPLQDLYLVRAAVSSLGLSIHYMTFDRCCTMNGDAIVLDVDDYVERLLNKNAMAHRKVEFVAEIERLRPGLIGDARLFVHGHDFICLLSWYLAEILRNNVFRKPWFVESGLKACLDSEGLVLQEVFRRVLQLADPGSGPGQEVSG